VFEASNEVKKRNRRKRLKNVFFVVQTINQMSLMQSRLYSPDYTWFPDYIIRINTILGETKGNLTLFVG